MDIAAQLHEISVFLYEYSLKTPLEEVANPLVAAIEISGIAAVDVMHYLRKIAIGSLNNQVVVISHEGITVNKRTVAPVALLEEVKKYQGVRIRQEDALFLVTTTHDVVEGSRKLYS